MRRGLMVCLVLLLAAAEAQAQLYYEPQPPPIVTADQESWFRSGEAITFEGHFYYPAGPRVYFDANVMVRTGAYRGIPLYADTTREPYSMVFVPLTSGLMQPYERRRTGDAAGGTGTQAPSFPVDIAGERSSATTARTPFPMAPAPPVFTQPDDLRFDQQMADATSASQRRDVEAAPLGARDARGVPSTVGTRGGSALRNVVEAGTRPKGLNEIYVTYQGSRWRSAGMAVKLRDSDFEMVGDYRGFPVYASRGGTRDPRIIFLPGRDGFVAPYERAGAPIKY